MKDITIELQKRDVTGKAVKQLRRDGLVPAVIHDHGKDSVLVEGPYLDLMRVYREAGKHHTVMVKAGSKQYMALIKTADFDPKHNKLRHLVFNAIRADQPVEAEIPVRMRLDEGNEQTPAERAGLIVLHQLESVEVEALPKDLPDQLEFDGEKLVDEGDQATVADLLVPAGVTVNDEPTQVLATVLEPSALQAANEAAGGDAEAEVPAEEVPAAEGGAEGAAAETPADETAAKE